MDMRLDLFGVVAPDADSLKIGGRFDEALVLGAVAVGGAVEAWAIVDVHPWSLASILRISGKNLRVARAASVLICGLDRDASLGSLDERLTGNI